MPTERRVQPAWLMCPNSHLFSTSVSQVLGGTLRVCTARAELWLTTPLPVTLPCSPVAHAHAPRHGSCHHLPEVDGFAAAHLCGERGPG